MIAGCVPFFSFATVAELRFGAHHARRAARLQKPEIQLAEAEAVWPGPALVESYVGLRHACAIIGHEHRQKEREAGRWIGVRPVA